MVTGSLDRSFVHVAALAPHGKHAAQKLTELYDELLRQGAVGDAKHVRDADEAACRRDFDGLKRFVATGIPLDEFYERQHGRVGRVAGWRNAVALVPLMLTWLALAVASWAYHELVRKDPSRMADPFLVLWQGRFDGMALPTFAETAVLSFSLLLIVMMLTVWAHRREAAANRSIAIVDKLADDALNALDLAVEASTARPPDNAKEWAEAASRVLTETQQMIKAAVRDTTQLAKNNADIAQTASERLTQLQQHGEEMLKGVGEETREVMLTLQRQSEQTTTRVGEEATQVLKQAGEANRQLVEQQMTPLFEGFKISLAEYRRDQETYRNSAAKLAGGIVNLTTAASGLADGVGTYATVGRSIDEKLASIDATQTAFGEKIEEHSTGIRSASAELHDVAKLITGNMKSDMEALAQNVVQAGTTLAATERSLSATALSLEAATRAMGATAANLLTAAAAVEKAAKTISAGSAPVYRRRRLWARLFGGR
ncbi:hypothetical protein [Nonomuraea lactucae]|uniref:hypothetical protein n=1 Tax=Nonomuraea lactucae TaxID=2249762 RepID=UPI0013B39495|nr:hypothetical protein [Nonomuraea lactucae]